MFRRRRGSIVALPLALVAILLAAFGTSSAGAAGTASWQVAGAPHMVPLTVTDPALGSTTLSDFPVKVVLTPSNFEYTGASADELAFVMAGDTTDTQLDYQIDTWNPGGTSVVWVKAPTLTDGTEIDLYYGSPTSGGDPYAGPHDAGTWTNGYSIVNEFEPDGATPSTPLQAAAGVGGEVPLAETAGNGLATGTVFPDVLDPGNDATLANNGATVGAFMSGTSLGQAGSADGGQAVQLSGPTFTSASGACIGGCGQYVTLPASALASAGGNLTFSVTVYESEALRTATLNTPYYYGIGGQRFGGPGQGGGSVYVKQREGCFLLAVFQNAGTTPGTTPTNMQNAGCSKSDPEAKEAGWYTVTVTVSGTTAILYVNGNQVATGAVPGGLYPTPTAAFTLGQYSEGPNSVEKPTSPYGFDQLTIANDTARSGEWVQAEYASQSNELVSFGETESADVITLVRSAYHVAATTDAVGEQAVLDGLGASLPRGASGLLTVDLTGALVGDDQVHFDQIGSYRVTVSDTDPVDDLEPVSATIEVVPVPVVTVTSVTVHYNVAALPTSAGLVAAAGAQVTDGAGHDIDGTIAADLSGITASPGTYSVPLIGTDAFGIAGPAADVTVVVSGATINLAHPVLVLQASATAPDQVTILTKLGASLTAGSGSLTADLSGATFDVPGAYDVVVSDASAEDLAPAQTATIEVVPVSVVTTTDDTVYFNTADPPVASDIISAAGAELADGEGHDVAGTLSLDMSHVDTGAVGSYTATFTATDHYGFAAEPMTINVVMSGAALSVAHDPVYFYAGDSPTPAELVDAVGATLTDSVDGHAEVDASGVAFDTPGTYAAIVRDSDSHDQVADHTVTVKVVPLAIVSVSTPSVRIPLSANGQVPDGVLISEAGAQLTDENGNPVGGTLTVDSSSVKGDSLGNYTATIIGRDQNGLTTSPITIQVVVYAPPVSAGTVTIQGEVAVGATLTADPGTWSPASTPSFQWLRDGQPITGATSATYTVVATDGGRSLSVRVTESPQWYAATSATSAAVEVPAAAADDGTTPTANPNPGTNPTPGTPRGRKTSAPRVSVANHGGTPRVTVDCTRSTSVCTGLVTVTTAVKSSVKVGKTRGWDYLTLGRVRFTVKSGQTRSLPVFLNKEGGRQLLAAGKHGLKVRVVVLSHAGGTDSTRTFVMKLIGG